MSMFSSPKFAERTKAEYAYLGVGDGARQDAALSLPALRARISDALDPRDERARAMRTANADTWQQEAGLRGFAPRHAPFQRAMQAGKARTRAVLSGANDSTLALIGRRGAISQLGTGVRGGAAQGYGELSNAKDTMLAGRMQADQIWNSAQAGALGVIGGYALGYGADKFAQWRQGQQTAVMNSMSPHGYDPVGTSSRATGGYVPFDSDLAGAPGRI